MSMRSRCGFVRVVVGELGGRGRRGAGEVERYGRRMERRKVFREEIWAFYVRVCIEFSLAD